MEYIPVANVVTKEADAQAVYDVVKSGWISKGAKVDEFEKLFAEYVGAKHAIAVNNGTSALHVVLAALGVGPGDEVIFPTLTFISTGNVVLYQNATPIPVECDCETYNVTGQIIEDAITDRTKAIIPVDMNGMPVDYEEIQSIGDKYGIPIVADSAESLGASYRGKKVGGICPIQCFSFFPNKSITTGEGGMITTSDDGLAVKMRQILNQGQDGRYNHVCLGYNYRMCDIQAALGIEQLRRIDWLMDQKNRIVALYNALLDGMSGVTVPHVPEYVTQHSWYMYTVQVDPVVRDKVVAYLEENGIQTRLSFPPVHIQPYYRERFDYQPDMLPISLRAWRGLINLPIWPELDETQVQRVVSVLEEALEAG